MYRLQHAGLLLLCCTNPAYSMPDSDCSAANPPCIMLKEEWEILLSMASCTGAGYKKHGTVGLLLRKRVLAHPSPKPVDSITCI